MRAAHVPEGINHGQDNQSEGQGDADMGDRAMADRVDDDGAGASKHQAERAKTFCHPASHFAVPLRAEWALPKPMQHAPLSRSDSRRSSAL